MAKEKEKERYWYRLIQNTKIQKENKGKREMVKDR